ncbi:Protein CBG11536 [Caenorhabditis briggsae]|uniref:Protein CBG11536 n=1 Tax=Caenorhabditis briggsae TaxID=6238 RepID=A8XCR7_CAEBR|nr:Protein CBG11536 [Caenorhabditis briggsae]CAP30435.2 Protein CBG11536 [Caenorhabditis briggsae]
MWQNQPQPINFNQYGQHGNGNNYYDILPVTTTLNPNPNASIDFVVTQVDTLANQINTLVADSEAAGLQIADRAKRESRVEHTDLSSTIPPLPYCVCRAARRRRSGSCAGALREHEESMEEKGKTQ